MKKIIGILLSAVLVFTAGCGTSAGNSQETGGQSAADTSSEEKTEDSAKAVNIGTMNLVNGDLIAQYEKIYEEELGTEVNIINFDSGKDVNTAFASGSIDISELGSSPTALGLANDIDYEVFWIGDIIGAAESLAVRNDSGIESLSDLKGKKIGTPFASTAHYSLLNALKAEGISEGDVTIFDLQPADIYAAWERGDIDAAYVWYPVLSQLLENGKTIMDSAKLAEKGVITADFNVVRTAFAKENPQIVANYVKAQIKANDILLNQADQAAGDIAAILEISKEDAAEQITQFQYLTAEEQIDYLENQIAETLQNTAVFLQEQDSIKSAPDLEFYKGKVTTEFIKEALK